MMDDPTRSRLATAALIEADLVAAPLPTLRELVWVTVRGYTEKRWGGRGSAAKAGGEREASWSTGWRLRPVSPFSNEGPIPPTASSPSRAGAPARSRASTGRRRR